MRRWEITAIAFLIFSSLATGQFVSMQANESYIGNDGTDWRTWEDQVRLLAYDLEGSPGQIIYDDQFQDKGFGVAGGRWKQLDYYENPIPRSEKLVIDFSGTVRSVELTTGMMGLNEGGNGFSETGKWTALDLSGNIVGSGLLGPEYSNLGFEEKVPNTYGTYPISCDPGQAIAQLHIEVTGFGHGEGEPKSAGYGENNSDFNIVGLAYERLTYSDEEPQENRPPAAVRDSFILFENTSITVDYDQLLVNDFDPDGDEILFDTIYTIGGFNGTLIKGETSFTFTPDPDVVGTEIITYRISDGQLLDFTNIFLIVQPMQNSELPEDGEYLIVPLIEPDQTLQVDNINNRSSALLNDLTCDDKEVWQITLKTDEEFEILNKAADKALEAWKPTPGNGDDATIYTSNNKDWQRWRFSNGGNGSYKIKGVYNPRFLTDANGNAIVLDDNNGVNQRWNLIPVSERNCSGNVSPIAGRDDFEVLEDRMITFTFADLLANDLDPDNDPLTILDVNLANTEDGTLEITEQTVTYTPAKDLNGQVEVVYNLSDGTSPVVQGQILINIEPVNDRPFTMPDGPYYINKNELLIINASELLANDGDVDGDEITFYEAIAPENGTLQVFGDNIWFRPTQDYVGVEGLFAYTITDGNGAFATREVGIVVLDNRPPLPVKDTFELVENTSITIDYAQLLLNDSDPDGDDIFFDTIYAIGGLEGTLVKGTSSFTYTPNPGVVGVEILGYRIEDSNGSKAFANVILVITPNQTDDIALNGRYLITSAIDGASLQVEGLTNRSNIGVMERSCDDQEKWAIVYLENGFHKLVNVASGKAMEAWSRNPSNDDNVTIYSDNGFDWQQWEITNGGEGTLRLKGKYNPRILTNSNANAIVRNDLNGINQQWIFTLSDEAGCEDSTPFYSASVETIDLNSGNWDQCMTVSATNFSNNLSSLGRKGDRVGPADGRYHYQIDYDGETTQSEKLIIDFNRMVTDVNFTIGNLEIGEYEGIYDETGMWTAYNSEGAEIGSGEISPEMGKSVGSSLYEFNIGTLTLSKIIFEATGYGHGAIDSNSRNNSDFSLKAVAFKSDETCVVNRSELADRQPSLDVFPNPSTDVLYLESNMEGRIVISDYTGKVLLSESIRADEMKVINFDSQWTSGIYFVRLTAGQQNIIQKVTITR